MSTYVSVTEAVSAGLEQASFTVRTAVEWTGGLVNRARIHDIEQNDATNASTNFTVIDDHDSQYQISSTGRSTQPWCDMLVSMTFYTRS